MKVLSILTMLVTLLIPSFVYAVGPCGDYEYAELKDMDRESFLKEYCKVRKDSKLHAELSMFSNSRQAKDAFESCYALMEKMERIYIKRFENNDSEGVGRLRELCK